MSETKSSLNALRQFRFEKSSEDAEEKNGDAEETPTIARKRVIALVDDSCSEAETSPTKFTPDCLSPNEKEQRLQSTMKIQPEYDMMDVQDALVHNKWDVSSAVKHLKNNCQKRRRIEEIKTPPSSTTNGSSSSSSTSHHRSHHHHHHHHHHHSSSSSHHSSSSPHKSSSHKSSSSSSKHSHHSHSSSSHHHKKSSSHRESARDEDSDDEDAKQMKAKVYDSDEDSDGGEVTKQMSKDRKKVFEFFNSSTLHELQSIKSCSLKKAQLLVELRPFRNWEDLVSKMRNNKGVSSEVLNQCQELLFRRHNLSTTMKKCNKLIGKLEAAVAAGTGLVSQPASLSPNLTLAEYQIVGLNWLAVMHYEGMNGILADEMGLGKTVQIIAFLTYLKEVGQAKKTHLIVVPSSTLDNWSNELERWSPSLVVERYYGSSDERKMLRCKYARGGLEGIDVLLTTYHMVSSTPEERKMFRVTNMHYVIYDEAHMLKNMTTARYVNLNRITAERRILLTGTPLQNNLLELMSLLCFVMPTLFGKNQDDMKDLFSKKIISKNDTGEEVMSFEHSQIEQAKKIMKPFVLRRLKRDVLNSLPKKTAINIPITMTKTQTEQYKNLVESYTNNGVVQSSSETAGISMMVNLRKLANHPLLLRHYYSDETVREIAFKLSRNLNYKKTNADHIFDEIAYLSDFKIYQLINKYNIQRMDLPDHLIEGSGKFGHLDELLPKLKEEGHRVLIFSQFTMMLDVLEKYLTLRSHEYVRIDGQTAVTERQDLIDQFTDDPEIFIFLLSTRAGGLGINLTAADTVILHDIDFNPYNDKQAEDRCHRMGQTKPVTIYRLITDGTIEQGMQIIAQEKLNLEKEVTADSTGENEVQEHKCMVRLLTMALGLDENKAETLLSPDKNEVKKLSRLCED